MAMIRICDICKRRSVDERIQKMTVVDHKGWEPMAFGGVMPGIKRKWTIDICDECLDAFKALRQEKVLSPTKEWED